MAPVQTFTSTVTRSVWASNLESEFELIRSVVDSYPVIAVDTKFPGTKVCPETGDEWYRNPKCLYSVIKSNAEHFDLIQLGLTLSDRHGNLPNLGTSNSFIWEFNFSDFDISRDPHVPFTVDQLRRKGVDLEKNRLLGIKTTHFAELLMSSGLVCNDEINWVTFFGALDLAFIVKALTQKPLPQNLHEFLSLVKVFFGEVYFDVKHLMEFRNELNGHFEPVSEILDVKGVITTSEGCNQGAASDSFLIFKVFEKICKDYFDNQIDVLRDIAGGLYALEFHLDLNACERERERHNTISCNPLLEHLVSNKSV